MIHDMQLTEWALDNAFRDEPWCVYCGKALCECSLEFCDVCQEPCCGAVLIDSCCPKCDAALLTKEAELGNDDARRRL